jgi:hypothetical protein
VNSGISPHARCPVRQSCHEIPWTATILACQSAISVVNCVRVRVELDVSAAHSLRGFYDVRACRSRPGSLTGGSPAEVGLHTSPRTQTVDQKTSNTSNFREQECDADQAGPRDASTAGVRISPKCPRTQQFSTEREPPVGLRGQPTARGEHAGEGSKQ